MIGILGGTFDPIHFGHIKPALALLRELPFTEIRLVPVRHPPHRPPPCANAAQRWHMLRTVVTGIPGLVADDRELRREGPSYTVDTLRDLRRELGEQVGLGLILGSDAYAELSSWHRWHELLDLCSMVVTQRPGYPVPEQGEVGELLKARRVNDPEAFAASPHGAILPWRVPHLDVSATAIRACIAAGEQPRYMLPGSVWAYICRTGLYGAEKIEGCR